MNHGGYGPIKVFLDKMEIVKEILIREGFIDPSPFQTWKKGQVFGLIKRLNNDLEMHVRGFDDFTLDSEVELSREYLEHPYDCRPFYGPLLKILQHYDIPFTLIRPIPEDPSTVAVPKSKTPWKSLLAVGVILVAVFGLFHLLSKLE